ncbi:MAG: hypothetical protein IJU81_02265 [Bacteroidales bacterium]|nr:hypothetical protein [Bacteroidales bacterium]
MKKNLFLLAAIAATMIMVSCTKEAGVKVFKASAEPATEQNKVTNSGTSLLWQAGDQISVYDASSNAAVYSLTEGAGTGHGVFAFESGAELVEGTHTAVSPAAIRTGAGTVSLPATQSSATGTLAGLPLYAVSDNDNLKFYNLCGVVRFRLTASSDVSVSSIAVTTNANTNGAATISGSGTSVSLTTPGGSATTTLSLGTAQSIASAHDFYMYLPAGSYSTFSITVTASNSATCTKTANSTISIQRGKITTITLTGLSFGAGVPEGALPGVFTVSSGHTVRFSKGNLQYIGSAATPYWKFADHQYDVLGTTTGQNSTATNVDRDLFGWGTSGWDNGNYWYMPYNTSNSESEPYTIARGFGYGPTDGSTYTYSLTGTYANADWGVYNAISNGGNAAGLWRTLTQSEWNYVFNTRSASTVNGTANARYAKATVNSVAGVILFPDSYTHPDGVTQPTNINTSGANFTGNSYSTSDWTAMETAGAVFLPAAGTRYSTSVLYVGSGGYYWSSTYYYSNCAYYVHITSSSLYTSYYNSRHVGYSVRVVRD